MGTTIESRPLRGGWWASDQGREVLKWFMGWGAVMRERALSSDPAAVPVGDWAVTSGKRGSPSDVADVLLVALEVSLFLAGLTGRHRRLAAFVFIDGLRDHEGLVVYEFADGSRSDAMPRSAPPPPAYERAEWTTRPTLHFDLASFPAPEVDEVCKLWKLSKAEFLERELRMVAKWFAAHEGL